jgi:hypothetical protein
MRPIEFEGQTTVFAKNQPEYNPLPAHVQSGIVTCCWRLNWFERLQVLFRGRIWHRVMTFNQPLQPQLLGTERPKELQV